MASIQLWVLTSVVAVMGTLLFWGLKSSVSVLVKRIESLVFEVRKLTEEVVGHHHRLDTLEDRVREHNTRMIKQDERIRTLEIEQRNGG